eukprot:jgi/Chrzof1/4192/Cz14g02120.t1
MMDDHLEQQQPQQQEVAEEAGQGPAAPAAISSSSILSTAVGVAGCTALAGTELAVGATIFTRYAAYSGVKWLICGSSKKN